MGLRAYWDIEPCGNQIWLQGEKVKGNSAGVCTWLDLADTPMVMQSYGGAASCHHGPCQDTSACRVQRLQRRDKL